MSSREELVSAFIGWMFVGGYLKLLARFESHTMALCVGQALIPLVAWRLLTGVDPENDKPTANESPVEAKISGRRV